MKKIIISLSMILFILCLVACTDQEEPNKPIDEENITVTYDSLYQKTRESAYQVFTTPIRHVAEHGYFKMLQQGYNNWYYITSTDSELNKDENQQRWSDGNSFIKEDLIYSKGTAIGRKFIVPFDGEVKISGHIKISQDSTSDVYVSLLMNDEILMDSILISKNDVDGKYHEHIVMVNKSDVIKFLVESSDGGVQWNPAVDYNYQNEGTLHYTLPNGQFLGDVHPFYDVENRKMYMYYLDTNGRFDSRVVVSDNMISYVPMELKTDPINPPHQDNYFVLGVYKDGDVYRTYFGLGDSFGSAESTDLITWKNSSILNHNFQIERKAFFDYSQFPGGGRDPFAFYDPGINRYHIIGMAYKVHPTNRSIVVYTSDDPEGKFFTKPPKELISYPKASDGDPECTMVVKIGKRWYIFTSRYGHSIHGVGRPSYYMGDENVDFLDVDWESKEERYLDGEDLIAAQLVTIGDKYYMYGWMPQVWNAGNWGGVLNIAREVVQREDGTLGSRIDPYLTNLLKKGIDYRFNYEFTGKGFNQNGNQFISNQANSQLDFNHTFNSRVFLEMNIESLNGKQGFTIKQNGKLYQAYVEKHNENQYSIAFGEVGSNHNPSAKFVIHESLSKFNLKLIVEGPNAVLSLNDFYTIAIRSSLLLDNPISVGLFANHANTIFNQVTISQLATKENIFD